MLEVCFVSNSCVALFCSCKCWALFPLTESQKKFYLVVNLVKLHPVEELVAKLKSGKRITKDQVIRESEHLYSATRILRADGKHSDKQGAGYRHCCHFHCHVTQVSALNSKNQDTVQVDDMYT